MNDDYTALNKHTEMLDQTDRENEIASLISEAVKSFKFKNKCKVCNGNGSFINWQGAPVECDRCFYNSEASNIIEITTARGRPICSLKYNDGEAIREYQINIVELK